MLPYQILFFKRSWMQVALNFHSFPIPSCHSHIQTCSHTCVIPVIRPDFKCALFVGLPSECSFHVEFCEAQKSEFLLLVVGFPSLNMTTSQDIMGFVWICQSVWRSYGCFCSANTLFSVFLFIFSLHDSWPICDLRLPLAAFSPAFLFEVGQFFQKICKYWAKRICRSSSLVQFIEYYFHWDVSTVLMYVIQIFCWLVRKVK